MKDRTSHRHLASLKWWMPAALWGLLGAIAWGAEPALRWPPFLPPQQLFPADVSAAVERTWTDRTISRTVTGPPVHAPHELYVALIDAPDVTAAASRFLQLARHEVRWRGQDLYEADDHDGAHGFYRLLVRERSRRVILSWGEHSGSILGTIQGSALTELRFEVHGDEISQTLAAHVRIENRLAAALAKVLVTIFRGVADRKLGEGLTMVRQVADWAVMRPGEFCAWLAREPLARERRAGVQAAVPACRS